MEVSGFYVFYFQRVPQHYEEEFSWVSVGVRVRIRIKIKVRVVESVQGVFLLYQKTNKQKHRKPKYG